MPLRNCLHTAQFIMPHVESLHVYPVKGCRPVTVQSAYFERTGLAFDRQWMFVKENKAGRFVTQRQKPTITLIETSIPADVLARPSKEVRKDAKLVLSAPGMEKLEVPLVASGQLRSVKVWEFDGTAYDQGDVAAEWITSYLDGEPHRLVRYAGVPSTSKVGKDKTRRRTDPKWTTDQEVAFADGYPALIVTQATLAELNKRLEAHNKEPLPMDRFRGNIVVTNCHACEEDEWEKLAIGGTVEVTAVKPCDRCKVTCTDQATAEVGKEPLITLKEFRSSAALDWDMGPHSVFFGWNLVPNIEGLIKVKDPINCLHRRTERVTAPNQQLSAVSESPDTVGALKAALTGGALAAAVASLLASFLYLLMKSVAANDIALVENPT